MLVFRILAVTSVLMTTAAAAQSEANVSDGGVSPVLALAETDVDTDLGSDRRDAARNDPRTNLAAARLQQRDYAAAVAPLQALANGGSIWAMKELAGLYLNGAGVAHDDAAALQLLRMAAMCGDAEAALAVGAAFSRTNAAEARRWLNVAVANGSDHVRRDANRVLAALN